ncbi:unnamed protein product [Alopecurus aequalis]
MSRMSLQGGGHGGAVALECKMVGGGSDGTLDVCARVCVIDEHENILYKSFVKPLIPMTHYRVLFNGEEPWKICTARGGARLLVGHGLDHDLDGLGIDYPAYLKRTRRRIYPPLMKTSSRLMSNSLKFLTRSCLGYDIQNGGHQHPYDDCVAAMRRYKRMRALSHGGPKVEDGCVRPPAASVPEAFPAWKQRELERMSPEELLRMSKGDYHCWCLDD